MKLGLNDQWPSRHMSHDSSMDGRSMVNLTPKVNVYGSKVKFSTRFYRDEIWHGWSLRHSKYVKNIFEVIQGHSRSLRGYYEATSGLMKHFPMELKFDMNDPYDNLNIYQICSGSSNVIREKLGNGKHLSVEAYKCKENDIHVLIIM